MADNRPPDCMCGKPPQRWRNYPRKPIGKLNCIWCQIECDRGKRTQVAGCYSCYLMYARHKDEPLYVNRYKELRKGGDAAVAPKEIIRGGYLYRRVRRL